ncbi:MAG: hypothetical protein J6B82_06075 [Bacteroidaceae bacterium]|nr:hypothetical protein [Bacteroidaceae bacterium]
MSELYWIMVLDKVLFVSSVVMFTAGLVAFISWIVYLSLGANARWRKDETDSDWLSYKKAKGIASKSFTACIIATSISVFAPSKEQMYMIVGVGTAIDYVQESESVRQLPDKCVDALNRWVDSLNKEEKQ